MCARAATDHSILRTAAISHMAVGRAASAATTVEIWPDGADRTHNSGEVANRADGCLFNEIPL